MLLTADWVLPVTGQPIRHGAVRVRGSRIDEVGPAEDLRTRHPAVREFRFDGCVITPGLVNAHTHLSLTALGGMLPSAPFYEWVQTLTGVMRGLSNDDLADSVSLGALRSLQAGTTVVGDVAYGPEALASAVDTGLGGVFFWEVFGATENELEDRLVSAEYPATRSCGERAVCGLTPHSIYTSGPRLLKSVWRLSRESQRPMMLHVAESAEETRLAVSGEGRLADVARRLAFHFEPPRTSPVAYLDRLGVLDGILAVHCVQLGHGDAQRLASRARGVALCPTSNVYLQNGPPPVALLRSAGARLAIGTDSPASAPEAHVLGEARQLARLDPALQAPELLRMMTSDGAAALGVEDRYGAISPGLEADLAAFRVEVSSDPVASLLQSGGPSTLAAVMTGGVWRIIEDQPAFNARQVERAAERVTAKVASLLSERAGSPGQM